MSAYVDQDQFVKFYYGNAIEDLKDFLPPDESIVKAHTQPSATHSLEASLSNLESILGELKGAQRELSYLVSDLGRMMKKVR